MTTETPSPAVEKPELWSRAYVEAQLRAAVLTPIKAMKLRYLPLLMVYFAYGATGLVGIAQSFWIKQSLTLSAVELAALGVWLSLPWTVKMVFGELVDTVPVLGSRRRGYVLIGGGLVALGLLLLAGAASGTLRFMSANALYVVASLTMVIGLVLQDVVADAMSTEVVPRTNADGTPRDQTDIQRELGMVQVLGRLALSFGIFATAGIAGWLASRVSYATVFMIGLIVPLISVTGALLVNLETPDRRPIDWQILGGGLAFGAFVVAMGLGRFPGGQEIVFLASMAVVILMLKRVVGTVDRRTQLTILFAAILIFVYRSTPGVGQGFLWYSIDKLGFDEAFLGVLGQIGAVIALAAAWLLSDAITRQPVARVLLWLVIVGAVVSLPGLGLAWGVHEWTERMFGIGPRSIAIVDTAATSPLVQISMIPMLTLIAVHAPAGHRAIWFALMASLMNLALAAGELQSKYLNMLLPVERGSYANMPPLYATVWLLSLVIPLVAILILGRRLR